MIRYSIKISISHAQITAILVLMLFGAFFGASRYIYFDMSKHQVVKSEAEEKIFEIELNADLKARPAMAVAANPRQMELGIENSEIMILKIRKKKSNKQKLDDFLASLTGNKLQKESRIIYDNSSAVSNNIGSGPLSSSININALLGKNESVKEELNLSTDALRKMVKKHNHKFQGCYERALLKDELLSGKAIVTLTIGQKADVNFKGLGKTSSIDSLKSCLQRESSRIRMAQKVIGKKVRFSLFFNS